MSIHVKSVTISLDEYLEGEQFSDIRHDYLDGRVYAMVGTSSAHNLIAINLVTALRNHLRGGPCQVFMSDMKVRVPSVNAFYYPDVLVACDEPGGDTCYKSRPLLIIEVLSPSTELKDAMEKRAAYQTLDSLTEYVLVAQNKQEVRIYRRSGPGWDLETCTPGDSVKLDSVGVEMTLDAIYEDAWR